MLAISARIAGFLLLIALVYCYYMHYSSLKFGGGDRYMAEERHIVVPNKEIIFPGARTNIRGRRIMSYHNSRRRETVEEIGIRGKDSKRYRILVSKGDYQGRFVAFNADYKGPRHHPPKNN